MDHSVTLWVLILALVVVYLIGLLRALGYFSELYAHIEYPPIVKALGAWYSSAIWPLSVPIAYLRFRRRPR